jgi:hypothetical protein
MLNEYSPRHDLDIVFLQEITDMEALPMPGYDVYYNIGSDICGTAIVSRNEIMRRNISKLPSGRAIAVECKGLHIVNIYVPPGTAKRTEREIFYNIEVPKLLQTGHGEIIIGATSNVYLSQLTHPAISIQVGPSSRRYVSFILPKHGSKTRLDWHIHITLTPTTPALIEYTYLAI